jgi:hypothetical protein
MLSCSSSTLSWSVLAVAVLVLAPAASIRAQAESTNLTIEEKEGDDGLPMGRRAPAEEPEAETSNGATVVRPADDPFFPVAGESSALPPLPPGKDIVTCLAGCDGPRGTIVYKK